MDKEVIGWLFRLEQAVGTPWEWGLPEEGPGTRDILLLIQMPSESQASTACSSEGSRDSYWSIRILLNWGSVSVAQSHSTLRPHGWGPARLLHPWDFPGKNSGVGCYSLLQGIFLTQGSNLGLPHCQQTLLFWASRENWIGGTQAQTPVFWFSGH